ncbi:dnaJ homolog subfamily C member 12 [Polypterus senegalus]|uniref:dnaJ homolog subfamily C member 12 n=1 Tax=Polypterus senegalus TaxID=55291 RepID=UPI00196305D1|nr:dnaJ homolog subfamily C member 12 [Polypterus senegalus]
MMDAILNCQSKDLEDYYALLGCDELSSSEQILTEFKARALERHPDKQPGNPQAVEEFQKLQKAKDVLLNEDSRSRYDYWRRCQIAIPFQEWEALSDSVKTSMHWAVKSKKEPMLEAPEEQHNYSCHVSTEESKGCNSKSEQIDTPDSEILADNQKADSPHSPSSPNENYWHLRFRWSADTPSELLRKFRNYEI